MLAQTLVLQSDGGGKVNAFPKPILGLERVVQFITGMANIRDVIPFPRTPGNADF